MSAQLTIPGAEPASAATVAKRRAAEPLRPSAPQLACDAGLFSDTATQLDLVDMARNGGKQ